MTKDEALQMCLEYIETDAHERKYVRHAIKAALEAKDDGILLTTIRHPRGKPALGDLNPESLETVEIDLPVAWRDAAIRIGEELSSVGPDGYYDMDAEEWLDWAMEQNPRGKHSLPQRTWVGLTDEDLPDPSTEEAQWARYWEAKLKEKNI